MGDSGLAASTSYSYRVRAADSAGNLGPYSAVAVGMTDAPDTAPPSVAISAPADGATVSHVVTISATASDNVGVSGVEFFADGVSLGTDTTAPYSVNWDSTTASNGLHALVAVASDADGNQATSAAVTVNAINPAFVNEVVVPDITAATTIAFLPDGRMLVGELTGHVWVVQAGANSPDPTPFLTIDYSLLFGEQGLMDIALDPNFAQNGYYYVFYTHGFSGQHNRDTLSRFTASGNSTVAGSELVLWQDDRDANGEHHGGAIAFGLDGKLYFTTGEHFDPPEAQDLTTFRGKVLRINSDGTVPTDNPFYDGAGPNKDAIWAYGLRNPYRMSIDPVTGVMYIGDVGGNDPNTAIEELDIGARGANYGWPLEEGDGGVPGTTPPIYSYPHNGRDAAITGGFVYRGTQFPSEYYGSYFFGDYVQNTLKRLTFDANGNVSNVVNFWPSDGTPDTTAVGDPVKILQGPDGSLYYVDIGFNDQHVPNEAGIHRISYSITNQPPVAVDSATPQSGQPPLEVSFSSAGSYDPEGATLTYSWNFGDGTTSTEANPTHTYTAAGHYVVLLSVSDGTASDLASDLDITVGTPPVPTILTPSDGSIFRAGDVIDYSGSATDAEDGTLSASAFSWTILFHHDTHIHPAGGPFDGTTSGSLTIPTTGHDFQDTTYYEIILTVTDSTGLSTSTSVLLYPDKVNVSFDSIPSGLSLSVDGIVKQTPFVVDDIIGFQHTIAAETQISGTSTYDFLSWSDGGAASHTVVVPSSDQSFTVTFGLHELDLNGAAAGTGYTSSWTGFAAIAVAIVDAAEATLDNPAGTNLTQLTAALTSPHTGDSLSANNSAAPGIAVSFAGGTLTLSGSDTLANYQAVLRTIKYTNTAGGPLVDSLSINLQASDGSLSSNVAVATVTFPPILDLNGGVGGTGNTAGWFNSGPVPITDMADATITAPSGLANLTGITVVESTFHTGDVLSVPSVFGISGISQSYSAGTLSLSGSNSVANYQKLLRLLNYDNTSGGPGVSSFTASVTATDGVLTSAPVTATINSTVLTGEVLGNRLFYNGSKYDNNHTAIEPASDALAIASDKIGFSGSGTATFANVSSFSSGITGVMVDLQSGIGAHGSISLADFSFHTSPAYSAGTYNNIGTWNTAPTPSGFSVILGGGTDGSDRLAVTWNASLIKNEWLEVDLAANDNTGLSAPDIFYFGSAVGESGLGNTASQITVNASDVTEERNNLSSPFGTTPVWNVVDFNKDGIVNASDGTVSSGNSGFTLHFIANPTGPFAPTGDSGISSGLAATAIGSGSSTPASASAPAWLFERLASGGNANSSKTADCFRQLAESDFLNDEVVSAADELASERGDEGPTDSLLAAGNRVFGEWPRWPARF